MFLQMFLLFRSLLSSIFSDKAVTRSEYCHKDYIGKNILDNIPTVSCIVLCRLFHIYTAMYVCMFNGFPL